MQIHFTLDDTADEALILWWLSLPKGQRSVTMRQMMRWYSGEQGFGALIKAVERLSQSGTTIVPEPEIVITAPPNVSEQLADAMSQFFPEDED